MAGEIRNYTTGRGAAPFARPEMIEGFYNSEIHNKLKENNFLIGSDKKEFIEKAAFFINEFNAIHPFIDGNGRLTRILLEDLAQKSGHEININLINKDSWYKAMEIGFVTGETNLIQKEISKCFVSE